MHREAARLRLTDLINLFSNVPDGASEAVVPQLFATPGLQVECTALTRQARPIGFHGDQPEAEWIAVLVGSADLRFDEVELRCVPTGDPNLIAPHRRPCVKPTDAPAIGITGHVCPAVETPDGPRRRVRPQTARGQRRCRRRPAAPVR